MKVVVEIDKKQFNKAEIKKILNDVTDAFGQATGGAVHEVKSGE